MEPEWAEPRITVNGTTLSEGQAMAVRVAVSSFLQSLALGGREGLGEVGELYGDRLAEVCKLIVGGP